MATYLTGDTHGNFLRVDTFCRAMETTKSDTIIILGDAGFNYYLNDRDTRAKEYASAIPVKFFSIHGNHEARPQRIPSYMEGEYCGGKNLYEEAFPNILFAVDGEIYNFDGYKCIVIGARTVWISTTGWRTGGIGGRMSSRTRRSKPWLKRGLPPYTGTSTLF